MLDRIIPFQVISSKLSQILKLESKGSFLKFGHPLIFIDFKEGNSKLRPHILLSFYSCHKERTRSLVFFSSFIFLFCFVFNFKQEKRGPV